MSGFNSQFLARVIAVIAVAGLFIWPMVEDGLLQEAPQGEPETSGSPVEVVTVRRGPIRDTYITAGTVRPRREVDMHAQLDGVMTQVDVQVGESVPARTILAAIDSRIIEAELTMARAAAERSAAERRRVEQLFETDVAELRRLEEAVAQNTMDAAAVLKLEALLEQSTLVSPFDGIVTALHVEENETVSKGAPILTFADVGGFDIHARIPEEVAARLRPGAAAEIQTMGADEPIKGTVRIIYPAADSDSHQVTIVIAAGAAYPGLAPGGLVSVRLVVQETPDALLLDRRAVPEATAGSAVELMRVNNGSAERESVTLGMVEDDWAEVISGLSDGDEIVVRGGRELDDGAAVRIVREGGL